MTVGPGGAAGVGGAARCDAAGAMPRGGMGNAPRGGRHRWDLRFASRHAASAIIIALLLAARFDYATATPPNQQSPAGSITMSTAAAATAALMCVATTVGLAAITADDGRPTAAARGGNVGIAAMPPRPNGPSVPCGASDALPSTLDLIGGTFSKTYLNWLVLREGNVPERKEQAVDKEGVLVMPKLGRAAAAAKLHSLREARRTAINASQPDTARTVPCSPCVGSMDHVRRPGEGDCQGCGGANLFGLSHLCSRHLLPASPPDAVYIRRPGNGDCQGCGAFNMHDCSHICSSDFAISQQRFRPAPCGGGGGGGGGSGGGGAAAAGQSANPANGSMQWIATC